MMCDESQWLSVTDSFYAAAVGDKSWHSVLEGLAEATDSHNGELIGIGATAAVPFNIITNVAPDFLAEFSAIGGGDPAVNPRVRAGISAPILKVLTESDFMTPDEYRRDPHVTEVAQRWDIGYLCLTNLERQNGLVIGLAVGRRPDQDHVTPEGRKRFASLAPHVRAAVRMQMALENQGATLVAGAMEALSVAAFVCDRTGRVRALTPAAEKLVSSGRDLQLRLGELRASTPAGSRALTDAIRVAAAGLVKPGKPLFKTLVLHSACSGSAPLMLEITALPRQWSHEFSFAPRVLVIARGAGAGGDAGVARRAALLQAGYGLTRSETDVALRLAAGNTAEVIAASRGASLETVRTQIKSIRAKLRVGGQLELVAILNQM